MAAIRTALPGVFLVAIFYGDVWLGLTVPVAMLVLPFVFIVHRGASTIRTVPVGFVWLLGIALPIALQFALGRPPAGKADVSVYLPIAYALATMLAFQHVVLGTEAIWRALVVGGCLTAAVMLLMLSFAPGGTFLVPGQDFHATQRSYQPATEEKLDEAAAGKQRIRRSPLGTGDVSAPTTDWEGFYGLKQRLRNALGQSNYISAFFVFLFAVALFSSRWTSAAVFALLTVATLSRFGMLFAGFTLLVRFLHSRGVRPVTLATSALVLGGLLMLVVLFGGGLGLPLSVTVRDALWRTAWDVVSAHPIVGAPRSYILDQFGLSILWHPHNILLWVSALAGIVGALFYSAFVAVALREIYRRATASPVWMGIFFGFVMLLTWSLFEPIAMTPAFELLLAALYTLARNAARS